MGWGPAPQCRRAWSTSALDFELISDGIYYEFSKSDLRNSHSLIFRFHLLL